MLSITRLFDAPREVVFEAFVEPKQALQWLGPRGYAMTHMEARPARGRRVARLHAARMAAGATLWHGGVYREIAPPERLAFTFAWELEDGTRDAETLVTIAFEDQDGKTLMRFSQGVFDTPETCEGYRGGWESEFDQLAALIWRSARLSSSQNASAKQKWMRDWPRA